MSWVFSHDQGEDRFWPVQFGPIHFGPSWFWPDQFGICHGGAPKGGWPKILRFLPPQFSFFLPSLGGSFRGILVVFAGALKCARLESPNVHIRGSPPSKTPPKFNEKTPREKKNETGAERGKNKRNFGGPAGCPAPGLLASGGLEDPTQRQPHQHQPSWSITSRRRWCDRILEVKRLSSERI